MMTTVPKLAALRKSCDVLKRQRRAFLMVPELKFAHPGVSISMPPPERKIIWREVVVCCPRSSCSRTACTRKRCIREPVNDGGLADAG